MFMRESHERWGAQGMSSASPDWQRRFTAVWGHVGEKVEPGTFWSALPGAIRIGGLMTARFENLSLEGWRQRNNAPTAIPFEVCRYARAHGCWAYLEGGVAPRASASPGFEFCRLRANTDLIHPSSVWASPVTLDQ